MRLAAPNASEEFVASTIVAAQAISPPAGIPTWRPEKPVADQVALSLIARDPSARRRYADAALSAVPRLLGAVDRNPYSPTYGCFDRQFWHYRTASFPSEMHQEAVWPLALIYGTPLPGNRWFQIERVRELAIAALDFSRRSSHRDGSCDDYYPFERALGAAVFSFVAAVRSYRALELNDGALLGWMERRARWISRHGESGVLANHHALAALGLYCAAELTGRDGFRTAAQERVERLLDWQSPEGWFPEYGGADPGYQTLTIDCLVKLRSLAPTLPLDEPLHHAVSFARLFLHPDDSYGGEYGSRGTYHFFPHGFERLAQQSEPAADLADGFLRSLAAGSYAAFDDDRMFVHRLGNLIEAHADWSPWRPDTPPAPEPHAIRYLPHAQLLIERRTGMRTIVSAARGGAFKRTIGGAAPTTDVGLIIEFTNQRLAVSQAHHLRRDVELMELDSPETDDRRVRLTVESMLQWARFETATPLKQAVFHTGMCVAGRWCRTLVRKLLQRRLITRKRAAPVRLTRSCEFAEDADGAPRLVVRDTIELLSPRLRVRRMSFAPDLEAAYVAAGRVYQRGVLQAWPDLAAHVGTLNAERRVTIERRL